MHKQKEGEMTFNFYICNTDRIKNFLARSALFNCCLNMKKDATISNIGLLQDYVHGTLFNDAVYPFDRDEKCSILKRKKFTPALAERGGGLLRDNSFCCSIQRETTLRTGQVIVLHHF
jgi:hypothetical protein